MNNIVFSYNKDRHVYGIASYDDENTHVELLPEESLVNMLRSGTKFLNVALKDNKIVGISGALTRFSPKTMVVLSRLCETNDKLVGYRIMSSTGRVFKWKLKSIQAFCKSAKAEGFVPFQNAIFVEDSGDTEAHIKSYPDCPFPTLILATQRKEDATSVEKQKPVNLKELLEKQDSLFTEEQKKQLRLGVQAGLNVAPYAHPEIPAVNMRVIREYMQRGQNVTPVTDSLEYVSKVDVASLMYVFVVLSEGIDVSYMLNPAFNVTQLGEIHLGLVSGLDVKAYAHPQLTAYQMSLERKAQEGDFWQEFEER